MRTIARTFTPVNRSSDRMKSTRCTPTQPATASRLLADANAQLLMLRKQATGSTTGVNRRTESNNHSLPTHLGWGSERLAQAAYPARTIQLAPENSAEPPPSQRTQNTPLPAPTNDQPKRDRSNIKLYPELAGAFLQHEVVATARVWLLLKQLDKTGQGWIAISEARQQLTNKNSVLRTFGWRQLRNILRAGSGIFWERDQTHIWLRSTAKVASAYHLKRLRQPVLITAKTLVSCIKTVRATFYAIGHTQRNGSPISRAKIAEISGVHERTQRRYDQIANVHKTANYCLDKPAKDKQEQAWHQRHAAFDFVDRQGKHGPAGTQYRAVRLPNSYSVHYQSAANGRTRKINQQLRQDLVKNRAQGNSHTQVDEKCKFAKNQKLFFDNGREASKQKGDKYLKIRSNVQHTFWVCL